MISEPSITPQPAPRYLSNPINTVLFSFLIVVGLAGGLLARYLLGKVGFSATPYVRVLAVGLATAVVAWCLIRSGFRIHRTTTPMGFCYRGLLCLNIVYFSIGIIENEWSIYILTDSIYLLLMVGMFFAGEFVSRKWASTWRLKEVFWPVVLISGASTALFAALGQGIASDIALVWLCIVILFFVRSYYRHAIALALVFSPALIGANRALLLSALVLSCFACLFMRGLRAKLTLFVIGVGLTSAVWSLFEHTRAFDNTGLSRRLAELSVILSESDSQPLPLALQQRLYEAELVVAELQDRPVMGAVLGLGHGFTLDMSNSDDESVQSSQLIGAEKTHNIHLLPHAILARWGIAGALLVCIILWLHVRRAVSSLRAQNSNDLGLFANLFNISLLVFAVPASSFFFSSMLFGFFSGVSEGVAARKPHGIQS